MKTIQIFSTLCMLVLPILILAQVEGVSIGDSPFSPDNTAMLDVRSTTKGVLIPRMTYQQMDDIDLAATPAHGLLVFVDDGDDTLDGFYFYDANANAGAGVWLPLGSGGGDLWVQNGTVIENTNAGPVVIKSGNDQANELFFNGTFGDDQPWKGYHSAIVERVYAAQEKSELLIFKGNDGTTDVGPDRLRFDATGLMVFQVGNTPGTGVGRDYDPTVEGFTVLTLPSDETIRVGRDANLARLLIHKTDPIYSNKEIGALTIRNVTGGVLGGSMIVGADANEINAYNNTGAGSYLHLQYENGADVFIGGHNTSVPSNLYVNGNTTASGFVTSSDRRLKTNIQEIQKPLDLILQSRGVTFERIGREGQTEYGMIAQEVEKVVPDLVGNTTVDRAKAPKTEVYKTLALQGFIPILIEAAKVQYRQLEEARQINDQQQQQIKALTDRLNRLEERINN